MQCTGQLFPLRINQMRHWIHTAFQEFVYLVREVEWYRWRTASGVTCSAMFHDSLSSAIAIAFSSVITHLYFLDILQKRIRVIVQVVEYLANVYVILHLSVPIIHADLKITVVPPFYTCVPHKTR